MQRSLHERKNQLKSIMKTSTFEPDFEGGKMAAGLWGTIITLELVYAMLAIEAAHEKRTKTSLCPVVA